MQGFIQLHRKMLEWEWYDDINTKTLFIHLLLKANWKDKKWRGVDIHRGEYITSFGKLSKETGLSIQQVRTSIKRLKSTQEVTQKSQGSFSIIEVLKYDEYQTTNTEDNKELTRIQQGANKELTTTNKDNKDNKEIIVNTNIEESKDSKELALTKKNPDIDILIKELKLEADILGIAYDKTQERNFGKHITTAKEFGNFCEKIGQDRIEFAKNIMKASVSINFWKGTCSGPKSIYQNYSDVYNKTKTKSDENNNNKKSIGITTI